MKKIISILLLFCLLLTACSNKTELIDEEKDDGQAYLISQGGNINLPLTPFKTFNPILNDNLYYFYFKDLIYSSLLEVNDDSSLNNLLASSLEKIDARTYRIKLREGVKFHDGKVLSVDDVLFTYNYIIKNRTNSFYYNLINNEANKIFAASENFTMSRVDNSTIEVKFNSESANNLYALTFPIISAQDDYANYIPNGTGPFKFKSYDKNKKLILEKNKSYFNGQSAVDTITGIIIENPSNIEGIFQTAKLDMYTSLDSNYTQYMSNAKYSVIEFPSNRLYYLGFNYRKKPSLDLRRLVEANINKEIISKEVFSSNMDICQTFYPKESVFASFDASTNTDMSNLSIKKNDNKEYVYENNKPVQLKILYNKNDAKKSAIANIVHSYLDNAGFKVKMLAKDENDINFADDYDIYIGEYLVNNTFDLNYKFSTRSEANFMAYSDQRYEDLLSKLYTSQVDYKDLNNFLIEEKIFIPLGYEKNALIFKENMIFEGRINFQNIYSKLKDLIIVSAKSWLNYNLML